jgi:hypothetical protein
MLPSNKFDVLQNNPNPFDDKSSIYFNSVRTESVNFKVYNMLGSEVYSNTINAKAGVNTIVLDANKFTQGIYFYELSNGVNSVTKRMVVSKHK